MGQKNSYLTIFLAIFLGLTTAKANNKFPQAEKNLAGFLSCETPPPDSFRIIAYGKTFVTLAWIPETPGDNHLMTLFKKGSTSVWDTLYSIDLNSETSYTLTDLEKTSKYKVEIRTKCSNGDPSSEFSVAWPPQGLILELTTTGYKPIDPKPVDPCAFVNYTDPENRWIGFMLSRPNGEGGEISSLFEFKKVEEGEVVGKIMRVWDPESVLMAGNEDRKWPIFKGDKKTTSYVAFLAGEIVNFNFEPFGEIEVDVLTTPKHVSMCESPDFNIQAPYEFQVFTASSVEPCPSCDPNNPNSDRIKLEKAAGKIKVQNPFSDYLLIFFEQEAFWAGERTIRLRDLNGKVVFIDKIDIPESIAYIPIIQVPTGCYILEVESSWDTHRVKLVKQ